MWEIILTGGYQLRLFPNGAIIGFDIGSLILICESFGYDTQALIHLIPRIEAGLRQAIKQHGDSNAEHFDSDSGH